MNTPDSVCTAMLETAAAQASRALAAWLDRPASVLVERIEALPLAEAVAVLGRGDEPICGSAMQVSGGVSGVLVLASPDAVGLGLADLLLGRPLGTSRDWGDLERSAVMETANILGCAYLNALAAALPAGADEAVLPSPPVFLRDYPAAVMEAAVVAQGASADPVVLAATEFRIDGAPVRQSLVFVPDGAGASRLGSVGGRGSRP